MFVCFSPDDGSRSKRWLRGGADDGVGGQAPDERSERSGHERSWRRGNWDRSGLA